MEAKTLKLVKSRDRIFEAVKEIFLQNPSFTGSILLDMHSKDGIIKDVFEIRTRRKV